MLINSFKIQDRASYTLTTIKISLQIISVLKFNKFLNKNLFKYHFPENIIYSKGGIKI